MSPNINRQGGMMSDKQPVDLYSPLAPDALALKLKAIMDDPMSDAKARVVGSGSQFEMTLRYARRGTRNDMAPMLDAAMEPYGGGTRISGTLGKTATGRMFPFIWFSFLSIFVIVGVAVAAFIPDMVLFGVVFAGVPILMMVIGGMAFRGIGTGDEDRQEILAFLRRELSARPMQ